MALSDDEELIPTMTPERWQKIEELFHSALQRKPDERRGFLDEACEGDVELGKRVEALLESLEEAGDFIEQAPLAGAISSVVEESSEKVVDGSLIGRRVGHYHIQSLLGAGGMGEVYLAHDAMLDRRIAIKILPAQFTRVESQVQRFEREARAASALNHPNIITIHEVGRDGEVHFIATEFVAGTTLREKIAHGEMSLREAVGIAIQIADALTAAQGAGIVHRDIKPENVMIRPDGLVKVLDFGLATAGERGIVGLDLPASGVGLQTDPDVLMGTITYLSPEQVRRERIDQRTDIFSLGVVLYEMITGARPFSGDSPASIFDAILCKEASIAGAEVPDSLKCIIGRALEKDRGARYQSAEALRDDLQQVIRDITESPQPKRWRALAALALSALVILVALIAAAMRRETSPEGALFSTGPIRRITDAAGREIFPSISPDGQSIVYASSAAGSWDIYIKKIGEGRATSLTPEPGNVDLAPAFSPDGTRIAFQSSREGSGIFLMDPDGHNVTKISEGGHNPAWSPDGREIAVAEDRIFDYESRNSIHSRLFVVDVQTRARRVICESDSVQPNWSPNGHRIAYWGVHKGGQRDIWTVPAAGGDPVAATDDQAVDWNPIWSRDGRHLYFLSDRGGSMNLWRVPIDEVTGKVTGAPEPATLPSANSQHVSFSADGRTLVYVEMSRRENPWQIGFDPIKASVTGQPIQVTRGIRRFSGADISPDEELLVFSSTGEPQEDIFIVNRNGGQPQTLTNDSAQDRMPRWSPDGQRIAFISDRSGKYEVWKINRDGSGLEELSNVPDIQVFNPVWSPDAKRLLFQAGSTSFIVEPGKAGAAPLPLPGEQMRGFLPWSWSADGKLLAGWQVRPELPDVNLVIYSFETARYERLADRGRNPIWLNDSKRLIFSDLHILYLLDVASGLRKEIHNVDPNIFGTWALSRDNRRLYYSLISSEADIHLVSLN